MIQIQLHRFNDIGTGTFFHSSTGWLKDHGIADGFGNGTFKPADNLTRGQASYWFSNYNDSIELVKTLEQPGAALGSYTASADCPAGKRAVAGGGATNSSLMAMSVSRPGSTGNWQVIWSHVEPGTTANLSFVQVWALCIPDPAQ